MLETRDVMSIKVHRVHVSIIDVIDVFVVCFLDILVDIIRNCEFSQRNADEVIIRQAEKGDWWVEKNIYRSYKRN